MLHSCRSLVVRERQVMATEDLHQIWLLYFVVGITGQGLFLTTATVEPPSARN